MYGDIFYPSKFIQIIYSVAGHVITGNLIVNSDSRIRSIFSKGLNYRFPNRIDLKKNCREEIASL